MYRDAPFVGEHSEAILSAIADLMLTRSPCDMDDADLLRSVWFLIAVRLIPIRFLAPFFHIWWRLTNDFLIGRDLLSSFFLTVLMCMGEQRYSDGFHEASKAFVHLVKWFQPNGSLLLPWLRRIYTPHLSLMRWAFALKDIALYLGSYMVCV